MSTPNAKAFCESRSSRSVGARDFGGVKSYHSLTSLQGKHLHLIAPNSSFARAVIMGNEASSPKTSSSNNFASRTRSASVAESAEERHMSNLSILLSQEQQPSSEVLPVVTSQRTEPSPSASSPVDEADSASGPPSSVFGSSDPSGVHRRRVGMPNSVNRSSLPCNRQLSASMITGIPTATIKGERVRRCMSSKELGTLAPPSGSPYASMLEKKQEMESSTRRRLKALKNAIPSDQGRSAVGDTRSEEPLCTTSRRKEGANEMRNRRRAAHNQAVVEDLCHIVADLFVSELKLLKPLNYGVPDQSADQVLRKEVFVNSIHDFVSALPSRYALGADTPSEVLLHMRLMAAARSDKTKVAVHIHNLEGDNNWERTIAAATKKKHLLRLVTIACNDAVGLLELISKLLATGGSRVLDADVMLSTDGIVLDRFVVEMAGRLRLDKLANHIESFLKDSFVAEAEQIDSSQVSLAENSPMKSASSIEVPSGPMYYQTAGVLDDQGPHDIFQEMETAVPLSDVLAMSNNIDDGFRSLAVPKLQRMCTVPISNSSCTKFQVSDPKRLRTKDVLDGANSPKGAPSAPNNAGTRGSRKKRPLVNRQGSSDLDRFGLEEDQVLDYVTIPSAPIAARAGVNNNRAIPLIPFDELMLIKAIDTGRISTIYKAVWQSSVTDLEVSAKSEPRIVAVKVAMVNLLDELRREADIAARLEHPNICDLVGVAADSECFCLAYDFCEGGSLLSLLSDSTRYYEYLPIALDIANGMAYLHSRNVIHRDLKPSNILLTSENRAKIADFGMSIANTGQELTAETGTYRYMAPEVIRHESYSSNADVYSFGICLWQLITREVPFATMTPIQAAYAVAEGRRPTIPPSTPRRLQEIILACWDQDSHRRPSFTYVAMALAGHAKMAFSPANVGAHTLQIANETLADVEGNSTINVDFTAPVNLSSQPSFDTIHSINVGLEIE